MNRPMSEVEAQLRMSLAAPEMRVAIEISLPKIRERYQQLTALALVTDSEEAWKEESEWFAMVMVLEHALRKATDMPQGARPKLVQMPERVI